MELDQLVNNQIKNINQYFSRLFANLNNASEIKLTLDQFIELRNIRNEYENTVITWKRKGSGHYALGFTKEKKLGFGLTNTNYDLDFREFDIFILNSQYRFPFNKLFYFKFGQLRNKIVIDFEKITNIIINIKNFRVPEFMIEIKIKEN